MSALPAARRSRLSYAVARNPALPIARQHAGLALEGGEARLQNELGRRRGHDAAALGAHLPGAAGDAQAIGDLHPCRIGILLCDLIALLVAEVGLEADRVDRV